MKIERIGLGIIIACFACLATMSALNTPTFEAPDEHAHYHYVRFIQREGQLPHPVGEQGGQFHQAPLYYVLLAPLASLLPDGDHDEIIKRRNPYPSSSIFPPDNNNKNRFLHTQTMRFPYKSETARAVAILRLVGVGLSTVTVIASYGIFRLIWPEQPSQRLVALAFVAFWPQFTQQSGVINNDRLAFLLATLALWLVLRQQKHGYNWKNAALLGIVLGSAIITKANLLPLAVPMGIITIMSRRSWRYAPFIVTVTLLVGGWWYLRNIVQYDDVSLMSYHYQTWPDQVIREGEIAWDVGIINAGETFFTLWGGGNTVPIWLLLFFGAVLVLSTTGVLFRFIAMIRASDLSREQRLQYATVAAFTLIWVPTLIYSSSVATNGNQARYLLMGITGWSMIFVVGLSFWLPERVQRPAFITLTIALSLMCSFWMIRYFLPAWQALPPREALYTEAAATYDDLATLVWVSSPTNSVPPGEIIEVKLGWLAHRPGGLNIEVRLHNNDGNLYIASLPGNGNLLASDWKPNRMWTERYQFAVPTETGMHALHVSLYDPDVGEDLSASVATITVVDGG